MAAESFPATAQHRYDQVGELRFHSVEDGEGPVLLLLAGWPQTCFAWRRVMPLLSADYRVIALDLKGQGETSLALESNFSIEAVAAEVEAYLSYRQIDSLTLVGHDVGAWVAYALSVLHPHRLTSSLLLDAALIGLAPTEAYMPRPGSRTWQFHFHAMAEMPELLTAGREAEYLGWYFRTKSAVAGAMTVEAVSHYVQAYSRPGAMTAGFNFYRAVEANRAFAEAHREHRFERPLVVYGGEKATADNFLRSLQACDPAVSGGVLPGCGHYLPEEAPEAVAELIKTVSRKG
ncbi:alpha/beta hydrolase [Cyanobium sp. HWJ4-Hawea]|uniref:alpha/beta fold hydrolase n=1 Tax=unclassified Cyanobium TaxID=2627006 RepID=UPI0020CDC21F|nr:MULTISPECIES: alpha/beta hydrolase [unclassified Cyanobium]MCP9775918.1 alpha/beta hydrolase [Cyanobium sp. WAJ14-Wanaka]MCP9808743.1 alpha/beta hydrolase [Cyanobium sp. HWJ4-Hawea]